MENVAFFDEKSATGKCSVYVYLQECVAFFGFLFIKSATEESLAVTGFNLFCGTCVTFL